MKPKAIIVSGYFNPIHKGHIEYFQNAKENGDKLFVIVNSDFQRALKGSKEFQDENERVFIVESLRLVDKCFLSIDKDRTVVESIKMIFNQFGNEFQLAFANGGDQNNDTIQLYMNDLNFVDGGNTNESPTFIAVLEDDDEDPDNITLALDEAAKFQAMLKYKYQQFLTSEFEAEQHRKLKDVIKELSRKRVYQEEEVKTSNKSR